MNRLSIPFFFIFTLTLFADPTENQLPEGGSVEYGDASFEYSSHALDIIQTTEKLISNWERFDIGSNASVTFLQPSSDSVALNRVVGNAPSEIFGQLNANGQVFLINTNGILFGQDSKVDVGGLLASTLELDNNDFVDRNFHFANQTQEIGGITNNGLIESASKGYIAFLSPQIENNGSLRAKDGAISLLAAEDVTVNFDGEGLINYSIKKAHANSLIENNGLIEVGEGVAILSAKAVDEINRSVINNSGEIKADSLVSVGGRILLTADSVSVKSDSKLSATGKLGGGQIQIGGSWQNNDQTVAQATTTKVEEGAVIDASATVEGNGGEIVVWSNVLNADATTVAHGSLIAQGGQYAGNGGRIETSGHYLNVDNIHLSATASNGKGGEWLIDPYDITVTTTATNNITETPGDPYDFTSNGASSVILADDIETQLNNGTSVTVQTGSGGAEDGNISIVTDIEKTAGGDASLTFKSHGYIRTTNSDISSSSNELDLTFNSDIDDNSSGGFTMTYGSINTNGGDLTIVGGSSGNGYAYGVSSGRRHGINISGDIDTEGGNITMKGHGWTGGTGNGVRINSDIVIDAGGGNIDITGRGNLYAGVYIFGDSGTVDNPATQIKTSGNGTINLTGDVADNGANTDNDEDGVLFTGGDFPIGALVQTENGDITITGNAGNYSPGDSGDNSIVSGVLIDYSKIETTSNGNIIITGTGADGNAGDGGDRDGVTIGEGSIVQTGSGSGGSGAITITGTAYARGEGVDLEEGYNVSVTSGSGGVTIEGTNDSGGSDGVQASGSINAINGDITITGTGGDTTDGSDLSSTVDGIVFYGTDIGSSDTNQVTINGTALAGDGDGIALLGIPSDPTTITTSSSGGISLTGVGHDYGVGVGSDYFENSFSAGSDGLTINGTGGAELDGVFMVGTFEAESGNITVTGTGGNTEGDGVYIGDTIIQTLTSGNISLTGTAQATGSSDDGIQSDNPTEFSVQTISAAGNGDVTFSGTASGAGSGIRLETTTINSNTGDISLTGQRNTGTGLDFSNLDVTIASTTGDIHLIADTASFFGAGNTVSSTGDLYIAPYNDSTSISISGAGTLNMERHSFQNGSNQVFLDGFNEIIIGDTSNTGGIHFGSSITFDDSLHLRQGFGNITTTSTIDVQTNRLTLTSDGSITQPTGYSGGSLLLRGNGTATLDSQNNFDVIASDIGTLTFQNTDAFEIGTVGSVSGITATGPIDISTYNGDITISQDVTTTDTSTSAMILNAGQSQNAGSATDENIVFSGSPTLSVGSGGRGILYSGTIDGSTDAANFVGSGTGRFRYYSDESVNNYTATLGSGFYLIYRERPDVYITANDDTVTYSATAYSGGNGFTVETAYRGSGSVWTNVSSLLNGDDESSFTGVTYSGTSQGQIDAGSWTDSIEISATDTLGYNVYFQPGTLTIDPATLFVTANDDSTTYDGTSYSGGNGVSYSGFQGSDDDSVLSGSVSYSGSSQGATNAGSYVITPSGLSATNYTMSYTDGTLTIDPVTLTVTANDDSITYDGLGYSGGNGVVYSGFISGEDESVLTGTLSYSGTSQGATDVGSYIITPEGLYATNYSFNYVNGTLTINQAPLTITANDDIVSYTGVGYSGGDGVSYSGFVNGEDESVLTGTLSYSGTSQGATDIGLYTIVPEGYSSSNYFITFEAGSLEIVRALLTITANDYSFDYNGLSYSGGNGVTYEGFLNGHDISDLGGSLSYSGTAQGALDAGTYSITPEGYTSDYYTIEYIDGTLTIDTIPLMITALDESITYQGMGYSGGNGVSFSGFVNGEDESILSGTLSYSGTSQGAINVGNYVLRPTGLSSSNYDITFVNGALVINQAPLLITANDDTLTYTGDSYSGGNGAVFKGFVNGETKAALDGKIEYGGSAQGATDPGSYAISISGLSSGNYAITYVNGTLLIDKAPLIISALDQTITYNGVAYSGGNGVLFEGFVNGEDESVLSGNLFYSGTSQGAVNAGEYSITPDGLTSDYYTIAFNSGTLLIDQVDLTITALNDSRIYNGTSYSGGNGVSYDGFISGENESVLSGSLFYSGSSQGSVNVGDYIITPGGFSSTNYNIIYQNGLLTTTPAPLTITANDHQKIYSGQPYVGGNGVTYQGFVNNEDESVLSGTLNYSGNSQGSVAPGSYTITPGGLTALNYALTFIDGMLTITSSLDGGDVETVNNPTSDTPTPLTPNSSTIPPFVVGEGKIDEQAIQVIVYPETGAPYVDKGFKISKAESDLILEPTESNEKAFVPFGVAIETETLALGDHTFILSLSERGLHIEAIDQQSKKMLVEKQLLVIREALLLIRSASNMDIQKIQAVYISI